MSGSTNNNIQIKVGICVAYDWEYLKISLPLIYKHSDIICLSLDRNRTSWSGKKYVFDNDAFYNFINEIDTQKKIIVYEDDFYVSELKSIENDTRQRNMMAQKMGKGGWHIQLDSDEYFVDFKGFVNYLKKNANKLQSSKPFNICCYIIPLFKATKNGFFYVKNNINNLESIQVVSNPPIYESARRNGFFNYFSPYSFIHQTWARSKKEIEVKAASWGHDVDISDVNEYIKRWELLDENNYKEIENFHPIDSKSWEKLEFVLSTDINDFIEKFKDRHLLKLSYCSLLLKNSRLYQKIKSCFKWFRL